jgi:hypothetical protein
LTLNPSGAISGTPTSPGSYSFGLTVGDPVTQAFTLSVAAPVTAAILTAAPASPAHASVALALTGADLPPLLRSGGALIMTGILILTLSAVLRRTETTSAASVSSCPVMP